ncbi:MAG: hypothetical protein Kow00129_17340 [Thermoleophilia bacterium]
MDSIATLTLNPSLDVHLSAPVVAPTMKIRCSPACRDPGGGGINVSRAVRKLGGLAPAVFPSGGETGELLHSMLVEEGVPVRAVPVVGLTRENFSVYETSTSEQYRFVVPGPALSEGEWRRLLDLMVRLAENLDYVVAGGSLPAGVPADFYAKLARALRSTKARLCLDTSGDPLAAAVKEGVFLIKPNFRELAAAAGREVGTEEADMERACREIVEGGGAEIVALTLEEHGALLVHSGGSLRISGLSLEVKSTVGAGDSFTAGLIFALARKWPLEDAFRFAVAAGSAAVITEGSELCRRLDVERLYQQIRTV